MSYFRFQKAAMEFSDCVEHISDIDLTHEEQQARIQLVGDAIRMLEELGVDLGGEVSAEGLITRAQ